MTPNKVTKRHEVEICQRLYGVMKKSCLKKYKYNVGDMVRISKVRHTFKKGYLPQTEEFSIYILPSFI